MKYIFVHGLGQSASSWDEILADMPKDMSTVSLDLFSLLDDGKVDYNNLYIGFSTYCNLIEGPLHLCGLSLGGILALNYALDHPTKVQSLVLIGTQYKIPKALFMLQNVVFRFMPNAAFKDIGLTKNDFIQFTSSLMALDLSDRLEHISCRTLVMCGERDRVNQKAAMALAKGIKGAKHHLLENTSHEANTNNPKVLATKLKHFYAI